MKKDQKYSPKYWIAHKIDGDDIIISSMNKSRYDTEAFMDITFGDGWRSTHSIDLMDIEIVIPVPRARFESAGKALTRYIKQIKALRKGIKRKNSLIKRLRHELSIADTEVYDRDGGCPASSEDGTAPRIYGNTILIRETRCYDACGCGGCRTGWNEYPIDGKRFYRVKK